MAWYLVKHRDKFNFNFDYKKFHTCFICYFESFVLLDIHLLETRIYC